MSIVLDTPEGIEFYLLASRKAALSLEIKGLRHSRGSVYALCKRVYGLKGNRQSVLAQMEKMVEDAIATRQARREQGEPEA